MISCRYKNNEIIAKSFIDCYGYEGVKELKTAGRKGLLKCKDPDCGVPLEYVHGEIRKYYFRHRKGDNTKCIYSNYNPGEEIVKAQNILYSHFRNFNNIIVKADEKLIPNHITHLVIEMDSAIVLAVEIIKHYYPDRKWDRLYQEYLDNSIQSVWIILSEPTINKHAVEMSFFAQKQIEENLLNCIVYLDTESKKITVITKHNLSNVKYPKFVDTDVEKGSAKLEQFYNTDSKFDIEWLEKARKYLISLFNEKYLEKERKEDARIEGIRKRNIEQKNKEIIRKKEESEKQLLKLNSELKANNSPAGRSNAYYGRDNYFDKDIAKKTVYSWLNRYIDGDEDYRMKLNEKIYNDINDFNYYEILKQIKNDYEEQGDIKAVQYCNRVFGHTK